MTSSWEGLAFFVAGAAVFAVAFWIGPMRKGAGGRRFSARCFILPAVVLLALAAGWFSGAWRTGNADARMRFELERQGQALARAINPELVKRLEWSGDDVLNPAFDRLRVQISSYAKATGRRSIYTMALQEGRILFGPESFEKGDPLASVPGTEYLKAPPGLKDVFATGKGFTFGPYADEFGVFVSAFSPLTDPRTGEVLAVVGLDLQADEWNSLLARSRLVPLVFALLFSMLFTAWGAFAKRRTLSGCVVISWREGIFLAFFLGAAITATISLAVRDGEEAAGRLRFAQLSEGYAESVGGAIRELRRYHLAGLAAVFEMDDDVTFAEFDNYVGSLIRDAAIVAYEWIPMVEGDSGRLVASLAAPNSAMKSLSGFDHASNPLRRVAIEEASQSLLPVVAGPVPLVEGGGGADGLVFYHPTVARSGSGGAGKASRVTGFAVAAVSPAAILDGILRNYGGAEPSLAVDLYQLGENGSALEIASWPKGHLHENGRLFLSGAKRLSAVYPIFAFGRAFAVVSHPGPAYVESLGVRLWWVALGVGFVLTALVAVIVGVLGRRRDLLEREVAWRTAELAETRERFAQMAELSREIIWEVDAKGLFTYVSRACMSLAGYAPEEVVGKMHFYDMHPEEGREEFKRRAFEVFKRRGVFKDLENRIVCKNGKSIAVITNGQPVVSKEGELIGYRGSDRDVSERVAVDDELKRRMAEGAAMTKLMVGREQRVIDLKQEVNSLLAELGREGKYGV